MLGGRVIETSPLRHDFASFRQAVAKSFVPLDVHCKNPRSFQGQVSETVVDDIHISQIRASAHRVERTPDLIAHADHKSFKLSLLVAGSGLLVQDGRETVLRAGDLALYDTRRPYTLAFDDVFHSVVFMFRHESIDLPADVLSELTAVRFSRDQGVGSAIIPFLTQMACQPSQLTGPAGPRLVHNALDLVTTMFSAELDLERTRSNSHHSLMQKIRAHIEANLAEPELGPSTIAAAHFISTRHLHGLFQDQGITVSSWIRSRRLEHCRRDLVDPVQVHRSVSNIASRWGFVDAAHFSKAFKNMYGTSPRDFRARGQAPEAEVS
ncbi:helix-turn-helix domain-containing protein [Aeromicrobium sp. 9AM]|uniref:AraC-like ligand-binding domain-containing protein n=1 Tax=Aeromicrobium sp. 9AM TaxID=2653126 RepID=UPI0012EFBCF6|nr:helix-turn-helix domain-containing protein [Aeromicrobium sp. 9AM]VXB63293.1 AraC family transcriptional regulator [Aeromicrobium sp. 9AM]